MTGLNIFDVQFKRLDDASGTREIWQAFLAFKSIKVKGEHQVYIIEEVGEPNCYNGSGDTKEEALCSLIKVMVRALEELSKDYDGYF